MKSKKISQFALASALCAMLFAHGCNTANDIHVVQAQAAPKWEYARLQHALCPKDNPTTAEPEERWLWATSLGDRTWADNLFRFHHGLAKGAPAHSSVLAILKAIGQMNWELVDYSHQSPPLNKATRDRLHINREIDTCHIHVWYFKRPAEEL